MCFDEGTLQSYIDKELDEGTKLSIEDHLKYCGKCQDKLNELKKLNNFTDKAFEISPINTDEAWKSLNKRINKERGVFYMIKKYKKFIASAAAVIVIVASITLPPVQKVEAQILSLFRLSNFKTVTVTPDDINSIRDKFYETGNKNIDLKQYGDIKVIGDMGATKDFKKNNLTNIKSYVGFDFKVPKETNGYKMSDSIYVQKGQTIEFNLNVNNINKLIKTFGGEKVLPKDLNGKTFKVIIGDTVNISSSNKNGTNVSKNVSYSVDIMKTPEIIVPSGVNIDEVRDAVLNMPFLPDDIKRQLSSIKDWKNTLPIPVSNKDNVKEVSINGNKGVLVSRNFEGSNALKVYSNLVFSDNGIMYVMSGNNVPPEELIKIAESMR